MHVCMVVSVSRRGSVVLRDPLAVGRDDERADACIPRAKNNQ